MNPLERRPIMTDDIKELSQELSKVTQAVGRRIGSPKNDLKDLKDLIKALEHITAALKSIRNLKKLSDS